MCVLFYGGSDSGKSRAAERCIVSLAGQTEGARLLYLATLDRHSGGDTAARIARHRRQRSAYGFVTQECPRAADFVHDGLDPQHSCILLEDIGNLCANELFPPPDYAAQDAAACFARIDGFLRACAARSAQLVAVSNRVGEGLLAGQLPPQLHEYVRLLGRVTNALASRCDAVFEVQCGVPLRVLR